MEDLITDERLYWMRFQMIVLRRLIGTLPTARLLDHSILRLSRLLQPRNYLGEKFSKEIYSSDFALQYALAARGWTIMPWEEAAQMHNDKEIAPWVSGFMV